LVTGRNCRRQKCRPRQSDAGCARRRPTAKPKDAGSIPATSTSQEYRPLNRDSALISGLYRVKRHEKDTGLSALRCRTSTYRLFGSALRIISGHISGHISGLCDWVLRMGGRKAQVRVGFRFAIVPIWSPGWSRESLWLSEDTKRKRSPAATLDQPMRP